MAARFVNIDHDTPLLLPPDLREWVPADHLIHFIMDAVGLLELSAARVNHSGSGSEPFPPSLMLGLLIYSYATGTFSSRRIEKNAECGNQRFRKAAPPPSKGRASLIFARASRQEVE